MFATSLIKQVSTTSSEWPTIAGRAECMGTGRHGTQSVQLCGIGNVSVKLVGYQRVIMDCMCRTRGEFEAVWIPVEARSFLPVNYSS